VNYLSDIYRLYTLLPPFCCGIAEANVRNGVSLSFLGDAFVRLSPDLLIEALGFREAFRSGNSLFEYRLRSLCPNVLSGI
jgi:hypothetical protein